MGYFVIIWLIVEKIVAPLKVREAINVPRDKFCKFRCEGPLSPTLSLSRATIENLLWPFSHHN